MRHDMNSGAGGASRSGEPEDSSNPWFFWVLLASGLLWVACYFLVNKEWVLGFLHLLMGGFMAVVAVKSIMKRIRTKS